MPKYRKINDEWHLYKYGDVYKAVYIKNAVRREKDVELLFPELEGLPEDLRADAIRSTVYGNNVVRLSPEVALPESTPTESGARGENTEERLSASVSRTKSRIYE